MITFHIISLFPDVLKDYTNESILGRAQKNKKIKIKFYNLRDFTKDKHRIVDDKSYGGGPGMVIKAEPIVRAVEKIRGKKKKVKIILLAAGGKQFNNTQAQTFSQKYTNIILIAGHYEGVDERVVEILKADKVSIGPYILTGGELPAMIIVDAVARQIYGVIGKNESIEEKRIASSVVYTRPEVIRYKRKNYYVPEVLLSGHHKKISEWRKIKQRKD